MGQEIVSVTLNWLGSAWIPVLLLVAFTLYCWLLADNWIAPPVFFGLYWVINLVASLTAVDHPVPCLGVWTLVSLILAVQLGALLCGARRSKRLIPDGTPKVGAKFRLSIRKMCLVLTLVAISGELYFIFYSLDLFGQSMDLVSLIQMPAKWTLLRYDGFIDPWPLRIAAVWIYPPALLGGIVLALSRSLVDKVIAIFGLFPSLLLTFLSGGRAAFLVALASWIGGYWSTQIVLEQVPAGLLRFRNIARFAAAGLALLLFYVSINTFRGASEASGVGELYLEFNSGQIRNYMFGPPSAFAEWLNRGDETPLSWGALTLPSLFDLLHIHKKTLGTYADSASTVGFEGTNIYTIFRGLIQDFGLPTTLVICALVGFLSSRAYQKHLLRTGWLLGLAGFYAITILSPLYCLFGFNGPIFAWLMAGLVLTRANKAAATLTRHRAGKAYL